MPLSPPVRRQHLHTRRVTCQGFFREDGLWDIEGRITDTKSYEHANEWRGALKPGELVHDMSIRLTLDHKFTIVDEVTDPVEKVKAFIELAYGQGRSDGFKIDAQGLQAVGRFVPRIFARQQLTSFSEENDDQTHDDTRCRYIDVSPADIPWQSPSTVTSQTSAAN